MAHHLLPVYLLQVLNNTSKSACSVCCQEHDLHIAQLYLLMGTAGVDQEKNLPAINLHFVVDRAEPI